MSKVIWKFAVPGPARFSTAMPAGAEILAVQVQGDAPQMWALVDPESPVELRTFQSFGTGHVIDASILAYLGTVQFDGGELVFHVFEVQR
jgi:hypothetical protein